MFYKGQLAKLVQKSLGTKPKEALDGLGDLSNTLQGILKNAPGISMDPGGTTVLRRIKKGICKDCSVLRGRVALTDKDGNTISIGSGVYLHHIGFLPGKIASSPQVVRSNCGGSSGSTRSYMGLPNMLFVQGIENFTTWYTSPTGNLDSGFYANSDTYSMIAEIVNYKSEKQSVYITVDYEFVPGKPKKDAAISYLSVTGKLFIRFLGLSNRFTQAVHLLDRRQVAPVPHSDSTSRKAEARN